VIATASGVLGTNREYLEQLAAQLALLQIEDDYIARLHASVRAASASRS
jgi:cation transport protein ChaC